MIDPEITTISIYRKDKKKLRAIAIANDLRDLKNHPSMREAVRGVSSFDKWQRDQCGTCQVSQSICPCDQRKFNYRDYKAGTLKLTQECPMRELP